MPLTIDHLTSSAQKGELACLTIFEHQRSDVLTA